MSKHQLLKLKRIDKINRLPSHRSMISIMGASHVIFGQVRIDFVRLYCEQRNMARIETKTDGYRLGKFFLDEDCYSSYVFSNLHNKFSFSESWRTHDGGFKERWYVSSFSCEIKESFRQTKKRRKTIISRRMAGTT